jgi:antitoxin YefM
MTNVISISEARANLPELVGKINDRLDRAVITVNGKPRAVMISVEELESIEETAKILAIPGALEGIREGKEQIKRGEFVKLSDLK